MEEIIVERKELGETMLKQYKVDIDNYICFLKQFVPQLEINHVKWMDNLGLVVIHPNIVKYVFPDLAYDKDGLVEGNYQANCSFKSFIEKKQTDCIVYPSLFFRRGYTRYNNFAPSFVEQYFMYSNPSVRKFIRLDYDLLKLKVDNWIVMERDMWYGARFTKDIYELKDGVAKLVPPSNLDQSYLSYLFSNVIALDIKIETKGNIKSFQLEEFKLENVTINYKDNIVHPVRYIHAEYDLMKKVFRHFDGAMHFYTTEEYYLRRDSDFNYNSKNNHHIKSVSKKLFKLEGSIPVETWIEFVSHFLSGNPLIHEYFEGELPKFIMNILDKIKK